MERSPHRIVVWDTETHTIPEGRREVMPLRLWAAEIVQRHGRRPTRPQRAIAEGVTALQLVEFLESTCRSSETVWAFAHNQGFDLAVTRLPLLLLRRGWTITAHALASDSPWARLARGGHRLVLADSTSWLPGKLEALGELVGIDKPPLPKHDDDEEDWWFRCRRDVHILAESMLQLLDWWDDRGLGAWSVTGPQCGFNALRHMPNVHHVVIDPDPVARAFERQALVGGRREVWRVGRQRWGDYWELDFRAAHATIAAYCPLPKRRSVAFDSMALDNWRVTSERWAPIAEVEVRTNTPRYPLQLGRRLWYPVGQFRTILCGPEIAEARRRGELLSIGAGYVYQLGQHMGDWGRWVLSELDDETATSPPVPRAALKAWSRNVPGKWATRTSVTWHEGQALEQGWNVEHGRHHPSGAPCAVLDMAGHREILLQDQDSDDCFPAVLAWIQSEVRVRLGRLIDMVEPSNMISCNTDGLICEGGGGLGARIEVPDLWPLVPREKARYEWVHPISPQHLILPTERRLSGVPANAEEIAPGRYSWMAWGRLPAQIASGESRGYVRERRTVDLSAVPVNRWVLGGGQCLPVTATVDLDGTTRLESPWAGWEGIAPQGLRPVQHPQLQALLDGLGA